MWSRLRPHVWGLGALPIAGLCAIALGQPAPLGPKALPDAGIPEPDDSPATPAAGTLAEAPPSVGSTTEDSIPDIPPYRESPERFAVAKFENQSGARAYDWLIAGAPFEISEKSEAILGLEPTGGSLHVTEDIVEPEPDPVLAFAQKRGGARWVITGWADRPNWQLRVGVTLWSTLGGAAVVVAETQQTGDPKLYHQLLGQAVADAWKTAGLRVDPADVVKFQRSLAIDLYSANLMGRGLGHLTGALAPFSLKLAEADLEKSVFIDPKNYEAQRLVGELYLIETMLDPKADPKLAGKAAGKFNYASDLAPDDIWALRGAAAAASRAEKHDMARDLWAKLLRKKPWDLDARYNLGAELWAVGDGPGAEKQLDQVTLKQPDHLAARRVLVLVHASRGDTSKLVAELEAIEQRAPTDLAVKGDLATAYAATGAWDKAGRELEALVVAKPTDVPLHVRLGDAKLHLKDLDGALAWYARAGRLAPDSTLPGFATAQALWDAGRLPEAQRAYINLQKYKDFLPVAEQALGAIDLKLGHPDDAAWYLRRAVRGMPREPIAWHALAAAELARKDTASALTACEHGLAAWPNDGQLWYFAGVAHAMAGEGDAAREAFTRAVEVAPELVPARQALVALASGAAATITPVYTPEIERPWGDAAAIEGVLAAFAATNADLATVRAAYQTAVLGALGTLGKGPLAPYGMLGKATSLKRCPVGRVAPLWSESQTQLRKYQQLGEQLEAEYRFLARHDDAGVTAGLLPGARAKAIQARADFRTILADVSELRGEFIKSLIPELRAAGCDDRLLADAVREPERYRVPTEDHGPVAPEQAPPRPKARATFYVDNTRCAEPVDVWIDGEHLRQIPAGRRSALIADGGERALCLITPSSAQCGERGTTRQVYLHDGWSTTLYCPK